MSYWDIDSSHPKLRTCEPYLLPNEEEMSMEEEEEEEDGLTQEQLSNVTVSTDAVLLSTPLGGLENPVFLQEDNAGGCRSRTSSQWRRLSKCVCVFREQPYNRCRSLSSSMEDVTFSRTQSPKGTFRDNAPVHCSRSRGIIIIVPSNVK